MIQDFLNLPPLQALEIDDWSSQDFMDTSTKAIQSPREGYESNGPRV